MPTPKPPKDTKKNKEQRAAQLNLENEPANRDVDMETKETVTLIFTSGHFFMRVGAKALDKIQDVDDPLKRRAQLAKKIKARPEDEEIPPGAKKAETTLIVAKAEHADLKGLL